MLRKKISNSAVTIAVELSNFASARIFSLLIGIYDTSLSTVVTIQA